jgi:tRNA(Glu) U13 pseudouridine synthase TruD
MFTFAGNKDRRAVTTQYVTAKKVPVEKLLGFQKHNVRGIVIGDVE